MYKHIHVQNDAETHTMDKIKRKVHSQDQIRKTCLADQLPKVFNEGHIILCDQIVQRLIKLQVMY